jgi:hypothetical protein
MWSWIIVIVLYLLGMGLFHILGGLAASAEAIRGWGEAAFTMRNRTSSSS